MNELKEILGLALLQVAHNKDKEVVERAVTTLINCYCEPTRHHHTLAHVKHMLAEFERHKQTSVEMCIAAFYHDAIYDVFATDNEEKSANIVEDVLLKLKSSNQYIDRVRRLILCTKTHQGVTKEEKLFIDADMSILAAHQTEYHEYMVGIKREYSSLPPFVFEVGRSRFIGELLQCERIFLSEEYKHLEERARGNLRSELVWLELGL